MNGYFLLNKPKGMSSFYALIKARDSLSKNLKIPFKKIKGGHAGTLDPLAEGLLLCAVGKSTKTLSYLLLSDKKYIATLHLGKISTTDDDEGKKSIPEYFYESIPTLQEIESVLQKYIGEIEQIPPVFSALKINGKRACDRTRNGENIKMKKRVVKIFTIKILEYSYPNLTIEVHCGTGTYIRSLARDIGKDLQQGAFLSFLQRTHIGDFSLKNAVSPFQLQKEDIRSFCPHHFHCEHIILEDDILNRLKCGQRIHSNDIHFFDKKNLQENIHQLMFWDKKENLIGIGEKQGEILLPKKIIV